MLISYNFRSFFFSGCFVQFVGQEILLQVLYSVGRVVHDIMLQMQHPAHVLLLLAV